MTLDDTLLSIAVAVVAGFLIGAERQQAHRDSEGADFGGVRTFPLVALLGALAGILQKSLGPWPLVVFFLGVVALLAVSHARSKTADAGLTSEVAALVTFALGALAGMSQLLPNAQRYVVVAAGAAITMGLLALKRPLHGFVARVSEDDVYATTKFVLLALVVIPLLPNHVVGPLGVLNPFKIGLLVALVAGISFVGYVAARVMGDGRSLLVTGFVGGLVSSTAVTLSLARRVKQAEKLAPLVAVGVLAASSTMFVRLLVVVAIADHSLLGMLAAPLGIMAASGYAAAFLLFRSATTQIGELGPVPLRNPFELKTAVGFGLLYAVVLLAAKLAQVYIGTAGIYGSAVLAGLTDVDAITLSLASLRRGGGVEPGVAATGIALAAATNTLAKLAIASVAGGTRLGRCVAPRFFVVLVSGALALLLTR